MNDNTPVISYPLYEDAPDFLHGLGVRLQSLLLLSTQLVAHGLLSAQLYSKLAILELEGFELTGIHLCNRDAYVLDSSTVEAQTLHDNDAKRQRRHGTGS